MPETTRFKMTRKNLVIDAGLCRAVENLYELYYLYLVEHPDIALHIEDLMYQITDCRFKLMQFQERCWKYAPPRFDSIMEIGKLINEARSDVLGKGRQCRGYFNALDRLQRPSLDESSKQDEQLEKLLDS